MSLPATPPRVCGCGPRRTEVFECEGRGWQQRCRWAIESHEAACSRYRERLVLQKVPDAAPTGHRQCSVHWLVSVRDECYDRQVGRNMCECPGDGISHTRNQLNKCRLCSKWLDEVRKGQEPTRTFVRFMISRLRDASDSSRGDRYSIHKQYAAKMSKYDWLPPLLPDGERRAYYSSSLTGRSHEAAYWLK